jgi:F-type H+-transporting ATPase subunit gamma
MKITEAMKLVAAAKVRRAQEAVVNGRPFAENLIKVCWGSSRVDSLAGFRKKTD